MSNRRISGAVAGNLTNVMEDYSISPVDQDSPGTNYTPEWSKWYGYYKVIPELQAVVDKKAIWTVGKGFKADENDKQFLNRIRGCGKDTFNSIIFNLVRQYTIAGDSFAEIIRNKRGELINLKPINPGSIIIHSDEKGMITGYSQRVIPEARQIQFTTDKIFHLTWNRLGDECHGISTVQKLENIILMRNEAMADMKTVFHRYVRPQNVFKLDTDDPTEIAAFKAKQDAATAAGENIYIPMGSVEIERHSIPQYSTLDPLPWINILNQYFILAEGVPEVILGYGGETTEASAKVLYLAFQQNIEHNQLFLENQIKAQLKMDVEFNFPISLEENEKKNISKEHKGMNTGQGPINLAGGKK